MSKLRLILKLKENGKEVKVYRDAEWDEYQVRLILDGALQEKSTYHTADKQDAIDTANIAFYDWTH